MAQEKPTSLPFLVLLAMATLIFPQSWGDDRNDSDPVPVATDDKESTALKQEKKDLPDCCETPQSQDTVFVSPPNIPDTTVLDQDGEAHNFYSDLVKGQTVAINFIFTTCKTICPPLTATFCKVQEDLKKKYGDEVKLISVSVDPTTDRPGRLMEFRNRFGAKAGWNFVTGNKQEIDLLLVALGAATPDKFDHSAMVLIGNESTGDWARTYGLAPAEKIVEVVSEIHDNARAQKERENSPSAQAETYFPNNVLITHEGESIRFYQDLLQGRMVLVHVVFSRCAGVCPPIMTNLKMVSTILGDLLGKDLTILSFTVDPEYDTPEKLREFADSFELPDEGWKCLTGDRADVKEVLSKMGAWVEEKEQHNTWLILGNEPTGDWRKLNAMAPPVQIADLVREMLAEEPQR